MSNTLKRFTEDGSLIYRPKKYPFEMIQGFGYIIQMDCFVDSGDYESDNEISSTYLASTDDKKVKFTYTTNSAQFFDSIDDAIHCLNSIDVNFTRRADGKIYPRILKVRTSCIVEGVAFEASVNEIEGTAKLEGVA